MHDVRYRLQTHKILPVNTNELGSDLKELCRHSALLSLDKVLDELPRHFLGQYGHVDRVVVTARQQGGKQDCLEVWLTEILELEITKLLQDRRLAARLDDGLVVWMIGCKVSH